MHSSEHRDGTLIIAANAVPDFLYEKNRYLHLPTVSMCVMHLIPINVLIVRLVCLFWLFILPGCSLFVVCYN